MMAIQIEILGGNKKTLQAAFYYPVPVNDQNAAAVDSERVAAGVKLSVGEIQDLKDGKIIEIVMPVSISGFSLAQAKAQLETRWTELQAEALAKYIDKYKFAGVTFDGSWS